MASIRIPCLFFCFLAFLCLSASTTARSQSPFSSRSWCTNVTVNSTYKANLNNLLSTLSSDIRGDTGFYNVSLGQGLDKVNAIALCRGDVGEDDCRSCTNNATVELGKQCPDQIAATVWLDECMLRYSNESIFGKLEKMVSSTTTSARNASNPNQFNQSVPILLNSLKDQAASGSSLLKFATGSTKVSDSESVYALMQCTPDLSEAECNDCLSTATGLFQQNCEGKQDCRVVIPSCNLRYENYLFFNSSTAAQSPSPASPTASLPSPAASPPPAASSATGEGQIKGRLQILATLVAMLFVFQY